MRINTRCSVAVHCLLFLHEYGEKQKVTSGLLALSTGCNPVVIRSVMSALKKAGIIRITAGSGGAALLLPPEEITLYHVYAALEEDDLGNLIGIHPMPSALCPGPGEVSCRPPHILSHMSSLFKVLKRDLPFLYNIRNTTELEQIFWYLCNASSAVARELSGGRSPILETGRENDMITGELKNKINALWEIFWTGGITNPLDVVEQMTYLMFIHDLDETDNLRARESAMLGLPYQSVFGAEARIGERTIPGSQLKWSAFHDFPAGQMYDLMQEWVFPFIKTLHADKDSAYAKYMDDAIFKIPTPLMLDKVVTALDGIYDQMAQVHDGDVRGDVYEFLLSKIATAGVNGQFRTPRHIIRMMVELMAPGPDDVICDPACGTAGFLVAAGEYLRQHRKEEVFFDREKKDHYMNRMFHGYDMDRTMLRIGAMNMMTHGVDNPSIEYRDSLSDQNTDRERYSLILANPPFKGSLDADIVSADLLKTCKTKKTELLFLALFLKMLKVGGRAAVIVPDGVLFGSSKAHKDIRRELVENHRLEAVISMPSGVFKPYAGVSTGVLVFTKTGHGGTDRVWFYDMRADGFSLDDKRAPVAENDIPDIVARFHDLEAEKGRERTEPSFLVDKAEIVGNEYDLSINKYKKTEYVPVEYPPTSEIFAELRALEAEIQKGLEELEGMV